MTTVSTRVFAILMIGIVVSLVGPSVPAGTIYYTDFTNTETGQFPVDWIAMDTVATWSVDAADELVVSSASDDTLAVYNSPVTLRDFTVSAKLHFNRTSSTYRGGLVGRVQNADSFYALRLYGTRLELYVFPAGVRLTYDSYEYPTSGPMITMSMTFDGSSITGEVRDMSGTLLADVSATDTTWTSGTAGLRAKTSSFGCAEFSIIPEPGAVALLISALAGLLIVRCKR